MTPSQPPPIPNNSPSIHDLVIADVLARKALGLQKYGTLLQAHNGRKVLQDWYEELLDALCYAKQALIEWDDLQAQLDELRNAYQEAKWHD